MHVNWQHSRPTATMNSTTIELGFINAANGDDAAFSIMRHLARRASTTDSWLHRPSAPHRDANK